MNNKVLAIILVVLAALFFVTQFFQSNKNRSFNPELVKIEKNDITSLEISVPGTATSRITKVNDEWRVTNGSTEYLADISIVEQVINEISNIEVSKVVGRSKEKQTEFEVDGDTGTRIIAKKANKSLADITLGRFSFNQQTRQPISYLKRTNQDETYLVNSFLAMSLKKDFNSLRDKTYTDFNVEKIESLNLQSGDLAIDLNQTASGWMSTSGIFLDSLKMSQYLSEISSLKGTSFSESVDFSKDITHSLEISLSNGEVIILDARELGENNYQMQSNAYKDNVFESNESGLFKRVFGSLIDLNTPAE